VVFGTFKGSRYSTRSLSWTSGSQRGGGKKISPTGPFKPTVFLIRSGGTIKPARLGFLRVAHQGKVGAVKVSPTVDYAGRVRAFPSVSTPKKRCIFKGKDSVTLLKNASAIGDLEAYVSPQNKPTTVWYRGGKEFKTAFNQGERSVERGSPFRGKWGGEGGDTGFKGRKTLGLNTKKCVTCG